MMMLPRASGQLQDATEGVARAARPSPPPARAAAASASWVALAALRPAAASEGPRTQARARAAKMAS